MFEDITARRPYRPDPADGRDAEYAAFLRHIRRAYDIRLADVASELHRSAFYVSTLERHGCDEAAARDYLAAIARILKRRDQGDNS